MYRESGLYTILFLLYEDKIVIFNKSLIYIYIYIKGCLKSN